MMLIYHSPVSNLINVPLKNKYEQVFIMREGKRVSNALYILCNKSLESNMTSHLAHMTSQTLDFPPDYEK